MPVIFVSDMECSISFYSRLGLRLDRQSRSKDWAEFEANGAVLALHRSETEPPPPSRRVELSFIATEPLERVEERLRNARDKIVRSTTDESFGRSLIVSDPDGLNIQINEHDATLYS
jgi:predicted enzyme related to lactoylglutathione lyase